MSIKIILVYAVKHERQRSMFTNRSRIIAVPQGEVHICEIVESKDGKEPNRFMFCGKTRSDIGEQTKDADKRPGNLPMCAKCEKKWKAHPASPWKQWGKARTP